MSAPCDHSEPWLATFLPSGHVVHAHPPLDHGLVERLHDLTHLIVARALGQPGSPALESSGDFDLVALEEAAVLAVTALAEGLEARRTA